MDFNAEDFVTVLLATQTQENLIDPGDPEELRLPEWFDDKRFKRGQEFFKKYFFGFTTTLVFSVVSVLSVPSMLKILVGTRKIGSPQTAYRRYQKTLLHIFSWMECDLRPGSRSWRSFQTIRKRHSLASKGAALKGQGIISQRDAVLTLCSIIMFSVLRPDKFGIYQHDAGDWNGFNHFWAVVGYLIGLEDRYNICLKSFEDTYEICNALRNRVFAPCLTNPPQYFHYMARVAVDGLSSYNSAAESEHMLFLAKNMIGVPGYIRTEPERMILRKKLLKLTNGNSNIGAPLTDLIEKCDIEGLPQPEPIVMYISDYDTIADAPAYKRLSFVAKFKLSLTDIIIAVYSTNIGRVVLNKCLQYQLLIAEYIPYVAISRYGLKDVFSKKLVEDVVMKPNSEYLKPVPPKPWYKNVVDVLL